MTRRLTSTTWPRAWLALLILALLFVIAMALAVRHLGPYPDASGQPVRGR